MNIRAKTSVTVLGTCGILGLFSLLTADEPPKLDKPLRKLGSLQVLEDAYRQWREAKTRNAAEDKLVLGLGWSKAFSAELTQALGLLTLDLRRGTAIAQVQGLDRDGADLWLVDNQPGPGASALPERGDGLLFLGRLEPREGTARLETRLDPSLFRSFEVDLAVVTRAGQPPDQPALLYGHTSLFQKLYVRSRLEPARPAPVPAPLRAGLLSLPKSGSLAALIDQGEDLFFNETFDGNGRTCGTCHPAENNFTIDPRFIAQLPPDDPLFVSERNPELADLERPELLRRLGLIVVNADGFDDPSHKFVMRSTSHTLGLRTSLEAAPNNPRLDSSTVPPVQRTGWSGDGAPGSGTLLEFSLGAVMQHNPRTLARVPGVDFRVPTTEELQALEAFQLSLGRQSDAPLFFLQFKDPSAAQGKDIFNNAGLDPRIAAGKCIQCHSDAGANVFVFNPPAELFFFNGVFDSGVEKMPRQPARLIDPTLPQDGGFGTAEACDLDGDGAPDPGVFGNCAFNVTPLIEAADTGPFFHNHSARTLEEAIAFYSTDAFNSTPPGQAILGIHLTRADEAKIAAFLRVINAVENIRQAQERQQSALNSGSQARARELLRLAAGENVDAAEVLAASRLHPSAIARLWVSARLLELAADGHIPVAVAVEKATRIEDRAREEMVTEAPPPTP